MTLLDFFRLPEEQTVVLGRCSGRSCHSGVPLLSLTQAAVYFAISVALSDFDWDVVTGELIGGLMLGPIGGSKSGCNVRFDRRRSISPEPQLCGVATRVIA